VALFIKRGESLFRGVVMIFFIYLVVKPDNLKDELKEAWKLCQRVLLHNKRVFSSSSCCWLLDTRTHMFLYDGLVFRNSSAQQTIDFHHFAEYRDHELTLTG
jgi:hypothetical protein